MHVRHEFPFCCELFQWLSFKHSLVTFDIIKKSGAWFSYNGERLAQGKENAMAAIEADPALFAEIEAKFLKRLA